MVLSTDSNQVQFQGIGNVKMVVRISRDELAINLILGLGVKKLKTKSPV